MILGLFVRPTAFILCGEMAVAYFVSWAPHGFWPISNGVGGELSVIDCFAFLWLVTAGAGPLSLDAVIKSEKAPAHRYRASRNLGVLGRLRAVHSSRRACVSYFTAWFPDVVWRVSSAANPLQASCHGSRCFAWRAGWVCIVGGLLLLLGLWTRITALVLLIQVAAAFLSCPRRHADWCPCGRGEKRWRSTHSLLVFHRCRGRPLEPGPFVEEAAARCGRVAVTGSAARA